MNQPSDAEYINTLHELLYEVLDYLDDDLSIVNKIYGVLEQRAEEEDSDENAP